MRFLLLALICATPLLAQGGGMLVNTTGEQDKLTASDAAASDAFGSCIDISGDTIVSGAVNASHSGFTSPGAAYVHVRNGSTWTEQQKLIASDPADNARFGRAVAIDGDTVAVGAPGLSTSTGAVYVFTRSGTTWTQQQKLTASDAATDDMFGVSVALDGDTIVVGASGDSHGTGANQGSAYVFTRSGATWTEQAKLTAADAADSDDFGRSVALDGDKALVGAPLDNHPSFSNGGSAYVFTRAGSAWTERAKLVPNDVEALDRFGESVSIDGSTAAIGAPFDDHTGTFDAGSVYVFSGSDANWTQVTRLGTTLPNWNEHFGADVSVRGDAICAGAPERNVPPSLQNGAVYVFINEGDWIMKLEIAASDMNQGDAFGVSVAMDGQAIAAGASNDTHAGGNFAGSAYAFIPVLAEVDQYTIAPDTSLTVGAAPGVLANDRGVGGVAGMTVIGSTNSLAGGIVVVNADGSFTYTPPAGFTGTDSFSYLASLDGVTIGALPSVWITVGNNTGGSGSNSDGACTSSESQSWWWLALLGLCAMVIARAATPGYQRR